MNNKQILESYIPLVQFFGKVCGGNYEIVLHDASNPDESIIAIANEHISGRKLGGPMTDLALKLIKGEYYKEQDYIVNHGRTKDNKILVSSTFFIKGKNHDLIGLLCINNNVTELMAFKNYLSTVLSCFNTDEQDDHHKKNHENIDISMEDLIKNTIDSVLADINISPERMSPEEKIQIVQSLSEQGLFLLKGAVSEVAKRLKTSEPTIYRYLNKKG
ncbi:helix-turn-helix transcriptional regulator [Desulfitobacterium hafniense]|nr:PAS domain-containing protein [Desulfitobacterium hafniense]